MTRPFNFLLFLCISTASFSYDKNVCHLTGKLENAPATTTLFLVDLANGTLLDSIQITNGLIDYKFQIPHPNYFLLHNKRNQNRFTDQKFIWLESGEIKINGNFNFIKNIKIAGSSSHVEFESYNLLLDEADKQINELQEQIHFKTDEEKKKDTLKINSLKEKLSDSIIQFLIKRPDSYVTLSSLHSECYLPFMHLNKNQIKSIYNELSENLKKSEQGAEIKKYIQLPEPPKIGDIAPEIIQVTPSGDTVKLSDFKGKYVLLDFWASSCGPCREEFKWLRRIYSKYHPKGFEILGVSSDNNKQRWLNAIKKDSITWINISDLKGSYNGAFLLYDIKMVPNKFLINPDGLIMLEEKWFSSELSVDHILGKIFENKRGL
jgi:peroxiredoxin